MGEAAVPLTAGSERIRPSARRTSSSMVLRISDVVLEELAGVFAALADALAFIAEPGAALFDDVVGDAEIDQVAFLRDAFAVKDVELGFAERATPLCSSRP